MASTLVQQYMHIVFHTKCTSITIREEDLGRIFDYVGGVIRNINLENIRIDRAGRHFICIDNDYSKIAHGDALKLFKYITIRNVSCRWAKQAFCLQGKPELPLENIRIENVTVDRADVLYELDEYAEDVRFEQVSVNGRPVVR